MGQTRMCGHHPGTLGSNLESLLFAHKPKLHELATECQLYEPLWDLPRQFVVPHDERAQATEAPWALLWQLTHQVVAGEIQLLKGGQITESAHEPSTLWQHPT
jgi:hypothetical protein